MFSGLEKSSELLEHRIGQHCCCCLWVRAGGKERQVKERAHEEMPAKSQQTPAAVLLLLLGRPEGCLWWEQICCSAYLVNYGTGKHLCNPELLSPCQFAALQHSCGYSSCSCLLDCIRGQTKRDGGQGRHKDFSLEKCCVSGEVQDSTSVRQMFTEGAAH